MLRKVSAVAAVAALLVPASADAGPRADARAIFAGLNRAVTAGRLDGADAYRYRLIVRRTLRVIRRVPGARRANLAGALHTVAAQARRFTRPRAVALFGTLQLNADYFAARGMPLPGTDIRDADGVVYRAFWGHGLQYHPLGSFGSLNGDISARRDVEAQRLAAALVERGVPRGTSRVWEYYFPFGGGRPPWTSGMAQAAGAQAFARSGTNFADPRLLRLARHAYEAVPGDLVLQLPAGPWIQHYSFSGLVVLNSHLQSTISLANYAALTQDTHAATLAVRMQRAGAGLLPRFDTGYWSRYSLGGRESNLHYHTYVVQLLRQLARRTGEQVWSEAHARFARYTGELPRLAARPVPTLYPRPADGHRDVARIRFWVSKVSTVTVAIAGERRRYDVPGGSHLVTWWPGSRPPGSYACSLIAVDLAGNRATIELPRLVVKRDREPPVVRASVSGRTLRWRAVDEGTPWVRLRLSLTRADVRRTVSLGIRPLAGSLRLQLPRGTWNAVLVAVDSSGNATRVPLGAVPAA